MRLAGNVARMGVMTRPRCRW